jgi:hypothetical protein
MSGSVCAVNLACHQRLDLGTWGGPRAGVTPARVELRSGTAPAAHTAGEWTLHLSRCCAEDSGQVEIRTSCRWWCEVVTSILIEQAGPCPSGHRPCVNW